MQIAILNIYKPIVAVTGSGASADMKIYVVLALVAVASALPHRVARGIIHEEHPHLEEKLDHGLIGESEHHHQVHHEHAKSHQSIKFEHFHPVPVYVKKEHKHLLEHPLEKGKLEHNLKLIHPETEHKHGGGLTLENYRHETVHHGLEHGIPEHHDFHGFEGGEALHGWHGGHEFGHQAIQEGGHELHGLEEHGFQGEHHFEGFAH